MKYVVFLDILGFKKIVSSLSQENAEHFIKSFSKTVYEIFKQSDTNLEPRIKGYVVSDSIILYSNNIGKESLNTLISLTAKICRAEFVEHGILIRGGIAKGSFNKLEVAELTQLEKTLIIGQAYIKAYQLESSAKVIGINLSKDVYNDIIKYNIKLNEVIKYINITDNINEYKDEKMAYYLLKYIDLNFLLKGDNLLQFVKLANKSEWLPHYYNSLYFTIKNERNDKRKEQLFLKIEEFIVKEYQNSSWRMLNLFIINAFSDEVLKNFKDIFLKHIRNHLPVSGN